MSHCPVDCTATWRKGMRKAIDRGSQWGGQKGNETRRKGSFWWVTIINGKGTRCVTDATSCCTVWWLQHNSWTQDKSQIMNLQIKNSSPCYVSLIETRWTSNGGTMDLMQNGLILDLARFHATFLGFSPSFCTNKGLEHQLRQCDTWVLDFQCSCCTEWQPYKGPLVWSSDTVPVEERLVR